MPSKEEIAKKLNKNHGKNLAFKKVKKVKNKEDKKNRNKKTKKEK